LRVRVEGDYCVCNNVSKALGGRVPLFAPQERTISFCLQ
jgi:hypothetical protein